MELLVPLLAVAGILGMAATLALLATRRPTRRRSHLAFVKHLGERLKLDVSTDPRRLVGTRLTGELEPDGREVVVEFHGERGKQVAVFAVEVRAAPRMRVTVDRDAPFLGRRRILGSDLEDWLVVDTKDVKKAKKAFKKGEAVRHAIVEAFAKWHATKVEVREKLLVAWIPLEELHRTKDFVDLVKLLAKAARAFDRVALDVKVLGGERFALEGAHGNARCAYCHEDLTGEEPDLVACESCGTVLHEACWSELGRCPLLGCTGTSPERARVSES